MKTEAQVDYIMAFIPEKSRKRWCGGERGDCACMGCVQISSRELMFVHTYQRAFYGDPEYLDESKFAPEIVEQCKPTKQEWAAWMVRHDL